MTAEPHLLVVASTFPAGPADSVPRFVYDQVLALKAIRPDWRITVLAPHDARSGTVDRTEHAEFSEVRFHYLRPRRWESLAGRGIMPAIRQNPFQLLAVPGLLWGEYRAVKRLVARDRPDLVYAHWFTPQAITAAPVGRRAGVPVVFTTHASDVAVWGRFGRLGRRIVTSVVRRAERFTAVSRTSLERMRPFFDDAGWADASRRSAIIPMGVDLSVVAAGSASAADPYPGRRVVLFMGRLAEKKGVGFLLDAFARTRREHPEALLVIAGDGPLDAALRAQAADLDLGDAVEFAGYRSGADKDALYRRADICVLPSIVTSDGDAEGLPVSLLEALAYSKPAIATDASNAGEIVTSGEDAVICPAADAGALADALGDLLSQSDAERVAMGAAARRTAAAFDWPKVAAETAAFLLDPYLSIAPGDPTTDKESRCAS